MSLASVSVILPNYNHAHYLSQSLKSILGQSVRAKEVIVIDDASTDNSVDVISKFTKQHSSIKLILNQKNMGAQPSNLKGLELATGDYIVFAAADDYLLPGIFELSLELLAKYPQAGICSALLRRINENDDYLDTAPEYPYISRYPNFVPPEKMLEYMLNRDNWSVCSSTTLFNRKMALECKAFEAASGLFMDSFAVTVLALNYGACFIPQELAVHRVLPNAESAKARFDPKGHLQQVAPMWKLMETTFADRFPPEFRKTLKQRHLYQYGAMATNQLSKSLEAFLEEIKVSLDNPTLIDRLFDHGARVLIRIQLLLTKAYLFFRLRKINIDVLLRAIYRIRHRSKIGEEFNSVPVNSRTTSSGKL